MRRFQRCELGSTGVSSQLRWRRVSALCAAQTGVLGALALRAREDGRQGCALCVPTMYVAESRACGSCMGHEALAGGACV